MGRSTAWTTGEVLTSTDMNLMPRGKLGYAEVSADQTGITSETDLTSLTVTFTPGTSRQVRVTGVILVQSDTTGDEATLRIKEGATVLARGIQQAAQSPRSVTIYAHAIVSPTAASHTYKLSLERNQGSGTLNLAAASTYKATLLVEDIGA